MKREFEIDKDFETNPEMKLLLDKITNVSTQYRSKLLNYYDLIQYSSEGNRNHFSYTSRGRAEIEHIVKEIDELDIPLSDKIMNTRRHINMMESFHKKFMDKMRDEKSARRDETDQYILAQETLHGRVLESMTRSILGTKPWE